MRRSHSRQLASAGRQRFPARQYPITAWPLMLVLGIALGSCGPAIPSDSASTPTSTQTGSQVGTETATTAVTPTILPDPGFTLENDWPVIRPENAAAMELIGSFEPLGLIEVLGSPERDHLAMVSTDRVLLLPFAENAPWGAIDFHQDGDLTVAASDGRTLALAFRDGGVKLYDVASATLLHELDVDLKLLEFSNDGTLLAGCDLNQVIHVWDIERGELLLEIPVQGMARSLSFSPDGRELAVELEGGMLEGLEFWSLENGERLRQLEWAGRAGPLYFIRIAIDWNTSAWASRASVLLMEMDSGDPIALLAHEDFVDEAEYSPDGNVLATSSVALADGEMKGVVDLWEVDSGEKQATLVNGEAAVLVAFSPDGELIASATYDGVIRIWDVARAELLAELGGGQQQVFRMFFAMEGRMLVTASWDGMIRFWAVETEPSN